MPQLNASIAPARRVPNARRSFWIIDAATGERREIAARLRTQTPKVAMWVEEGVWHDVRQMEGAAEVFGTDIYDRMHAAFGSEWIPGIDGDPRISILHATGLGGNVLGYASTLDEYPSDIHHLSNEAELITINLERVTVGSRAYHALLAQELVRLVQWYHDPNEERWIKEGLTELGGALSGSETAGLRQAYLDEMDVPLTSWVDSESQRGASYLLMAYFHQRFGEEGTRTLTAEPANGVQGLSAALESLETGLAFEDLLTDWLAATYLDSVPEANVAPYGYPDFDLDPPKPAAVYDAYPVETETSVHQLGADVILLRGEGDLRIHFTGQAQTHLLPEPPHIEEPVWWSNRADESLTRITRGFGLRELEEATLTYRIWYDIESHYDYAFVEISSDGGESWQILPVPSGTDASPHGNNPGWGYTGESGGWIQEEVDISGHAGGESLVRFSYLTDGAITGAGLLLDDVSVLEIEDEEDDETERSAWDAEGFVLTDGFVPQDYLVLLISRGEETTVERLPLAEDRSAEWVVPLANRDTEETVLIVSAVAPFTRQPASYRLALIPAGQASPSESEASDD